MDGFVQRAAHAELPPHVTAVANVELVPIKALALELPDSICGI